MSLRAAVVRVASRQRVLSASTPFQRSYALPPSQQVVVPTACTGTTGNQQQRLFSTNDNKSAGFFTNWSDNRSKKVFREQMEEMTTVDVFNVGAYYDALVKQTSTWTSKMPGVRGSSEMKKANQSKDVMAHLIELVGREAGMEQLEELIEKDKLQMLRLANDCNVSLERLEMELQAFEMTVQTHRLVLELKKRGKEMPETPDEMKLLMQTYARHILTPEEKKAMEEKMKQAYMKQMGVGKKGGFKTRR